MKNTILFFVSFLFIQQSFCQKDSLYVGWGMTRDSLNKSRMFLRRGMQYYHSRQAIVLQYKVTVTQPLNDGVVIVTNKRKSDGKIFYSIFCRIWFWEYVVTLPELPTIVRFDTVGDVTLKYGQKTEVFQRTIFASSPGIIKWQGVSVEPVRF